MTQPFSTGKDRAFVQPGAAGRVLTSNGASANPTYQVIPANPNAPAPGAAGTILTSNGTSVAPTYQAPQINPTKIVIASADLLLLPGANPIVLAAPGAGKVLVIDSVLYRYIFGTTPYTPGNVDNNFQLSYGSDPANFLLGGASINLTGFADQSVNMIAFMADVFYLAPGTLIEAYPETDVANQPIVLTITGTTPGVTLGDGSLEIEVLTHVFTL